MSDGSDVSPPRARPGAFPLRPEVVAHHQRERLLAAVMELVAERGFRAITVADIVKRGKVARARFYENFSNKQDCFLVAYERALSDALDEVERVSPSGEFPERVRAGIEALLKRMAEHPEETRACVLGAPELGAAASEATEAARSRAVSLLKAGRAEAGATALPADLEDSILGGLYWIVYQAVLSGMPAEIEDLLPDLVEFALGPFLGVEGAHRAATAA